MASVSSIAGRALKERSAAFATALLCPWVFAFDAGQQQAGELFGRQRIGAGRDDQFAELLDLSFFQQFRLVAERFQFGIEITRLTHCTVLELSIEDSSVSEAVDQRKYPETSWDEVVLRKINSFEGALIRRADVRFEV